MKVLAILAAALALVVALGLVWRRASWPCPVWLVPLLENPWMRAVAGAPMLLERAGVGPGMSVLDAGCGPGRLTLPAAARVGPAGRVVALDLQPGMLRVLRRRVEREGLSNVEIVQAGLGEGSLPEAAFDVALLATVLGEVRDKPAALAELARSLRPGGLLSVTEVLPDPHYQRAARVRALAEAAGLRETARFRGGLAFTANFQRPLDGRDGGAREIAMQA